MTAPGPQARSVWRSQGRSLEDKGWVPLRYWAMWWGALAVAVVVFYVVLTPVWIGLRAAAWVAELRARRRRRHARGGRLARTEGLSAEADGPESFPHRAS